MDIRLSGIKVTLPSRPKAPLFFIPELKIAPGTKLLIEGASGKGKTTLLHLIAGLFSPSEGYVFLDNENLNHLSDTARSKIRREKFGIIFQKLNLLDHLTALENVMLTAPKGFGEDKAREALQKLGINEQTEARTAHLSLGEQQRVAVARVLVASPQVILADEPTSSLDEANANVVMDGLEAVAGNPTLIVVSHDQRIRSRFDKIISFEKWVNA